MSTTDEAQALRATARKLRAWAAACGNLKPDEITKLLPGAMRREAERIEKVAGVTSGETTNAAEPHQETA